jgi:HSP20 family protein
MATEMLKKTTPPKALEAWDPWAQMRMEMARLWSEPWGLGWPSARQSEAVWAPRVDMFDRGNKLVVKTDLPGIRKDGVEVSLENGYLVIRGEHKEEKESEGAEYYRMERSTGSFYRRLALPFEVEARAVSARFNEGLLEIEIERPAEAKPKVEKVTVR